MLKNAANQHAEVAFVVPRGEVRIPTRSVSKVAKSFPRLRFGLSIYLRGEVRILTRSVSEIAKCFLRLRYRVSTYLRGEETLTILTRSASEGRNLFPACASG